MFCFFRLFCFFFLIFFFSSLKAGWKESHATFMTELRNLQATGLTTIGQSLRTAFDLLNLNRLVTGIDNYGQVCSTEEAEKTCTLAERCSLAHRSPHNPLSPDPPPSPISINHLQPVTPQVLMTLIHNGSAKKDTSLSTRH